MDLIVEGVGKNNPDAYCALLDNDQLIPCLATGATFPGFQELTLPTFAPTYKKKVLSCPMRCRKEMKVIQKDIRTKNPYMAVMIIS